MAEVKKNKLLIENAAQLLTMRGENNHDIGMVESGCVYIEGENIKAVGTKEEVEKAAGSLEGVARLDASGKVVMPGFVDSHTHVVFGGSRVVEYSIKRPMTDRKHLRNLEYPQDQCFCRDDTGSSGRTACRTDGTQNAKYADYRYDNYRKQKRLRSYTPSEMKMLEVNRLLSACLPMEIVPTFWRARLAGR